VGWETLTREILLAPADSDSAEFTVSYWKVDPGDPVRLGDELLVVESVEEKTALAVTAPCAGVLAEIVAPEGQVVAPGDLLGRIEVE
jgi:2-oxoglutarate dehydrogenase E2 component (dihydrolipoamide succinyltransferase)